MPYLDSADARSRLKNALRILADARGGALSPADLQARVSAAHDELSKFEQASHERERHLTFLWEHSPQLHWIADADDKLVWVSKSWGDLTGRPIDEALGEGWRHFVHQDDAETYFATARDARDRGGSYDIRFRGLTSDGSYRWLRTRAVTRLNGQGRTEAIYGFTEDVHDQVLAETALQHAVERSGLAGLATNDLIYDLDVPTGTMQWNSAIRDYCQDPSQATLAWWQSRVHPADRQAAVASLQSFLDSGGEQRWQAEYRLRRLDGSYAYIYERGFLLRGEDDRPRRMIGALTDLTARVEAEARINQLQSELIHVSRLSAMGAMAATLAHELNQPLAAANNWVGVARVLAQKSAEDSGRVVEVLDEARSSITRAGEIIRRIRSMLWRGNNNRAIHDVRDLVDESLRLALLGASATGIACRLIVQSHDVLVDRVQIEQVLMNLIRNAIEAMSEKERRDLVIGARPVGDFVEVHVSDTGCGFTQDLQTKLFTPFVTTKDQGLGVGLSISRTIVEEHGGTIRALTNPEGGATFIFTLPRAVRAEQSGLAGAA